LYTENSYLFPFPFEDQLAYEDVLLANIQSSFLTPRQMKPNVVTVTTTPVSQPLTALPTAKIVRHPSSKIELDDIKLSPPDEETLRRLNVLAKQHPFSTLHKGSNRPLL